MARCHYCRQKLPCLDTVCQTCLDARYDQIAHPKPWWHRIRLTRDSLYALLFVFAYGYILLRIDRDHHPTTITGRAGLAFALAASITLIVFVRADSGKPGAKLGRLLLLLLLFAFFFLRIWVQSTYPAFPMPALFGLLAALVGALSVSFRDPPKVQDRQKKGAEARSPAPMRYDSRDAV